MIEHNDYILLEGKDKYHFEEVLKKANDEGKTLKAYSVEDGEYSSNDIFNGTFEEAIRFIKENYINYEDEDCDFSIALIHIGKSGGCEYTEEVWSKDEILEILNDE